jgi:Myotubularin-like phosphatase domain
LFFFPEKKNRKKKKMESFRQDVRLFENATLLNERGVLLSKKVEGNWMRIFNSYLPGLFTSSKQQEQQEHQRLGSMDVPLAHIASSGNPLVKRSKSGRCQATSGKKLVQLDDDDDAGYLNSEEQEQDSDELVHVSGGDTLSSSTEIGFQKTTALADLLDPKILIYSLTDLPIGRPFVTQRGNVIERRSDNLAVLSCVDPDTLKVLSASEIRIRGSRSVLLDAKREQRERSASADMSSPTATPSDSDALQLQTLALSCSFSSSPSSDSSDSQEALSKSSSLKRRQRERQRQRRRDDGGDDDFRCELYCVDVDDQPDDDFVMISELDDLTHSSGTTAESRQRYFASVSPPSPPLAQHSNHVRRRVRLDSSPPRLIRWQSKSVAAVEAERQQETAERRRRRHLARRQRQRHHSAGGGDGDVDSDSDSADVLDGLCRRRGEELLLLSRDVRYLRRGIPVPGMLAITNYKVVFLAADGRRRPEYCVPLPSVDGVQKVGKQSAPGDHQYCVELTCKDRSPMRFSLRPGGHPRRLLFTVLDEQVDAATRCAESLFAFRNAETFEHCERPVSRRSGWRWYDAVAEYERIGVPCKQWRLSSENRRYALCATYPQVLAVPAWLSDEQLAHASQFRSKHRLPVLSWRHPRNGATITRAAQPKVGVLSSRSAEDELLLDSIRRATPQLRKLLILDARPVLNATVCRGVGGGYESSTAYANCVLEFLGCGNIHAIRDSLAKVMDLCRCTESRELDAIASSRYAWAEGIKRQWLSHVSTVLKGAVRIVQNIRRGQSVFAHCSDGWDRTPLIISLALVCLDPYYRTVRGFGVLVEKEWLSFGHPFALRYANPSDDVLARAASQSVRMSSSAPTLPSPDVPRVAASAAGASSSRRAIANASSSHARSAAVGESPNSSGGDALSPPPLPLAKGTLASTTSTSNPMLLHHLQSQRSPSFLLFLDAVHQIMRQHRSCFEYNSALLRKTYHHLTSGRFGTFLANCDQERRRARLHRRTVSFWSYVDANRSRFVSAKYIDRSGDPQPSLPLMPDYAVADLHFWSNCFSNQPYGRHAAPHLSSLVHHRKTRPSSLDRDDDALENSENREAQEIEEQQVEESSSSPIRIIESTDSSGKLAVPLIIDSYRGERRVELLS